MSASIYTKIASYYDEIFPLSEAALNFVEQHRVGDNLLDVGCGTGSLVLGLARKGVVAAGIDLDKKMVERANQKRLLDEQTHGNCLFFVEGDMRKELLENAPQKNIDFRPNTITILGNSLVHLKDANELKKFFSAVNHLLSDKGCFIIQILNYEFIEKKDFEFDLIETDKFSFKRNYYKERDYWIFRTVLEDYGEGKCYEGNTFHYPLRKDLIHSLLLQCGFASIESFSGFSKSVKEVEESFVLVLKAQKK